MRFCVIRGPGTNCDIETKDAVEHFGAAADIIHIRRFIRGEKELSEFDGLLIPGGFSFGDHVRSGAIMGKIIKERFGSQLERFAGEGKPIIGICNGFQILVESGLLPGFDGISNIPQAALGKNVSSRFEDRWVYLKNVNRGNCIFTKGIEGTLRMPVAHGEGKLILPQEKEGEYLEMLEDNDQIVFCYAKEDGTPAKGKYPENPNGSIADIAGICNPEGTVFGLMPHPERAFYRITYPDWTRTGPEGYGDGFHIFKNMVEYVKRRY